MSCCFFFFLLTGMNLHLARRTAEQQTSSILPNVIIGGRRLSVACTNTEAHLRDQRTSPAAVARKWGAIGVIQNEDVLVWLQRQNERTQLFACLHRFLLQTGIDLIDKARKGTDRSVLDAEISAEAYVLRDFTVPHKWRMFSLNITCNYWALSQCLWRKKADSCASFPDH